MVADLPAVRAFAEVSGPFRDDAGSVAPIAEISPGEDLDCELVVRYHYPVSATQAGRQLSMGRFTTVNRAKRFYDEGYMGNRKTADSKIHWLTPIWMLMLPIILVGCSNIDYMGMRAAQKKYELHQRNKLVAFMSLDVMFSDPSVRLLAKAAGEGKIETIDRLVAEGVNVNSRGTQNVTPLYWALRDYNGFSHLLSLGADPNVVYGDGGTVMHWAAQKKDIRFLKTALQYGGNPNLVNQDASKQTPIFSALYMGVTHVDVLLDGGANIDAVDQQGCTPVIYAVNAGWYDLAYELLIRGADYRMPDHQHGGSLLANQVGWIRSTVRPNSKEAERLGRIVNWLEAHGVKVPSSGWEKGSGEV